MQALTDYAARLNAVEACLRTAASRGEFIGLKRLFAVPEVAKYSNNITNVRDVVHALRQKGCIEQRAVDASANDGDRVAFAWKEGTVFELAPGAASASVTRTKARAARPGAPVTMDYAAPNPNEVELVINGIEIIAGVNPLTGRIRVQIGG